MGDECSQHFLVHEEQIKNNTEDIKTIYKLLEGIPQTMEYIKNTVEEIKSDVKTNDHKYVTKDYFELAIKATEDRTKIWVYGAIATGLFNILIILVNHFWK